MDTFERSIPLFMQRCLRFNAALQMQNPLLDQADVVVVQGIGDACASLTAAQTLLGPPDNSPAWRAAVVDVARRLAAVPGVQ
jgi:hypothetical protein